MFAADGKKPWPMRQMSAEVLDSSVERSVWWELAYGKIAPWTTAGTPGVRVSLDVPKGRIWLRGYEEA
jgi:hypothetical protein